MLRGEQYLGEILKGSTRGREQQGEERSGRKWKGGKNATEVKSSVNVRGRRCGSKGVKET